MAFPTDLIIRPTTTSVDVTGDFGRQITIVRWRPFYVDSYSMSGGALLTDGGQRILENSVLILMVTVMPTEENYYRCLADNSVLVNMCSIKFC